MAMDMTMQKTRGSSDKEWRESMEKSNPTGVKRGNQSLPAGGPPSSESASYLEGRRKYQCAYCKATHFLNLCPQLSAFDVATVGPTYRACAE